MTHQEKQEKRIQEIVNGDLNNNHFVSDLLNLMANEPDDLIRGIAVCHLKEQSPKIIQRLLLELEWRNKIG